MFDWPRFLRQQGVPFVTRGPNVGAGQIGLHCPWCGPMDPSHHLSVSLRGEGYRCWRNPRLHVGRARWRLISALLNCSPEEAKRLGGEETVVLPEDEGLAAQLVKLMGGPQATTAATGPLKLPTEFKPLRGPQGMAAPFWYYLEDPPEAGVPNPCRGLGEHAAWVCSTYGLHYATRGRFSYRVIVPIHDTAGRLMTWTARDITHDKERVRYKTLPGRPPVESYDGPLARKPPSQLLLGLPFLTQVDNAKILLVCEGPFDAIKVSALGRAAGVYGTCLFGLDISESQALLIERLAARFERVIISLDPDASTLNLRIKEAVTCPVTFGRMPQGVEDPGALTRKTFNEFLQQERVS